MKAKTCLLLAASTVTIFSACGDNSASPNSNDTLNGVTCSNGLTVESVEQCATIDNGVQKEETNTLYICENGKQVLDATECKGNVADSSVTTVYLCVNGEKVLNAEECPSTITCTDGKIVNDINECVISNNSKESSSSTTVSSSNSTTIIPSITDDDDSDIEDAKKLDGTEILLTVSGTSASIQNDNGCLELADKSVTVTCPGDYYFTGSSTDFQVVVNTPGTDNEGNTGIYLYNVDLKSSSAPILIKNADKTILHLVKGTTNSITDGTSVHEFINAKGNLDSANAAIYSKDDLNIKGAGNLTVTGNYKNGIQSSNDLKIKNGNITVNATDNGIKGKGSVLISGGSLNITAKSGDGIKSDECEENTRGECIGLVANKGVVYVTGGKITIKSGDDGIEAYNYVMLSDSAETMSANITSTGKGILSDNNIYVNCGDIELNATDDGIHAKNNIYMNGGNVTINSGDDGIHADSTLRLLGSTINVQKASEGMEAFYIRAEAGITSTYGTDDGWNAAGGTDGSGSDNGWGARGPGGQSSSKGYIIISGGYHYISASGNDIDVLDANGTATQTGGVLILEIPTSSQGGMGNMGGRPGSSGGMGGSSSGCSTNGAGGLIDTDSGYKISGGVMLAFGNQTEEYPNCSGISYTNSNYYGASNAAFKPQGSGSMILYGGSVTSVAAISNTSGMNEIKFPNGLSYLYK